MSILRGNINNTQNLVGAISSESGIVGAVNPTRSLEGQAIPRGNDGISPTVTVDEVDGGHRITIKDIHGTKQIDVMDGQDGKKGEAGKDGNDGQPGEKGDDGQDGKDAYQYAKEAGFEGAEEEFARQLAYVANIDLTQYAKKNEVPKNLSQMAEDETHRTVTDAEKQAWNAKSDFSGNYEDLANKPTILTRVLLWDNTTFHDSNQCANNTKVTVTGMNEEYSGVEVLFYCYRGGSIVSSGFIPKDTLNSYGAVALGVTGVGELVKRTVKYSGNVFTFGAALIGTTANNTFLLPWRIYGYK